MWLRGAFRWTLFRCSAASCLYQFPNPQPKTGYNSVDRPWLRILGERLSPLHRSSCRRGPVHPPDGLRDEGSHGPQEQYNEFTVFRVRSKYVGFLDCGDPSWSTIGTVKQGGLSLHFWWCVQRPSPFAWRFDRRAGRPSRFMSGNYGVPTNTTQCHQHDSQLDEPKHTREPFQNHRLVIFQSGES